MRDLSAALLPRPMVTGGIESEFGEGGRGLELNADMGRYR